MDPIEEKNINLHGNGKPAELEHLLMEVGVSHNTLRLHLDSLAEKSLIVKDKQPVKGPERPRLMYSMSFGSGKFSGMLLYPSTGVVSLSFNRLSQIWQI